MQNEIIQLMRDWHVFFQVLTILVVSALFTLIVLSIIDLINGFLNISLPTIIRGHPPIIEVKTDSETPDKNS